MNDRKSMYVYHFEEFFVVSLIISGSMQYCQRWSNVNCIFTHMYWTVLHNCAVYNVYNINL